MLRKSEGRMMGERSASRAAKARPSARNMPSKQAVWRRRPLALIVDELGAKPWRKQRQILNAVANHDRVAVRSCNGSGKTYIAAHVAVWWLMANRHATVVTTAPTDRQVRQLLWREINAIHSAQSDLIGGKITSNSLRIDRHRFAVGFSTDQEQRFQGFHQRNLLFIVDEASGVRQHIFEAIEGSMTAHGAKILMIGNPNALEGYFFNAFHKNRGEWNTIHISAFDTPNLQSGRAAGNNSTGLLTRQWVENARRMWREDSAAYQTRVLGQFPKNADDTLIPLQLIEDAVDRRRPQAKGNGEEPREPRVMGIDIARYGDDRTVACVRTADEVTDLIVLPKEDAMSTAGRALSIAREKGVDIIVVDEVGIGAGVLDRIREAGRRFSVIGVNGANKPSDSQSYANTRAELYDKLKQRFEKGEISIPDDDELIGQLASLRYFYNSKGQMRLEEKHRMRARGAKSPDRADALMYAFAKNEPQRWFWN